MASLSVAVKQFPSLMAHTIVYETWDWVGDAIIDKLPTTVRLPCASPKSADNAPCCSLPRSACNYDLPQTMTAS